MDRRLFTAALAAGAATGLAAPASAFLGPLDEDERIELLQIPDLGRLRTLFRNAPRVISRADLPDTGQTGLKLILTPRLNTQDGSIRMAIRGQVKDLSRPLLTMDGTAAGAPRVGDHDLRFSGNVHATGDPGILVRDVQTQARVRDGQTIVIGGLLHHAPDHGIEQDMSLPFFGDLPVIGHAFRSNADSDRHRELVIFVTARIVLSD